MLATQGLNFLEENRLMVAHERGESVEACAKAASCTVELAIREIARLCGTEVQAAPADEAPPPRVYNSEPVPGEPGLADGMEDMDGPVADEFGPLPGSLGWSRLAPTAKGKLNKQRNEAKQC